MTAPKGKKVYDREVLVSYVLRAQAGEHSAFEELVKLTERLLRKVALPLLPSSAVDDVLQETYLLMYQKIHYLKEPKAFLSWLTRIALNVCHNWRRKIVQTEDVDSFELEAQSEGESLDIVAIRGALSELKEKDRNILILREYLGMAYDEIADALDLPEGTVRSRLFNARKKLKVLLQSSPYLKEDI